MNRLDESRMEPSGLRRRRKLADADPTREQEDAWYFDTSAGKEEILFCRIGRNEMRLSVFCEN